MKKVIYIILISLFSLSIISCEKEDSSRGSSTINPVSSVTLKMSTFVINTKTDNSAPILAEVTAVTTPTIDTTPDYTFSSTEAGTITYGGSCSSDNDTSATADNNTITFNALADGTYSDCYIKVTDNASNTSDNLSVSSFTIDSTLPGGTIKGSVLSQSNLLALSGVSVSFAKSGTTIVNTTTDSSGDFNQAFTYPALDTYTLTYSKSGYLDEIQSAKLSTDNQTLVVSTLKMLSESCSTGTISGTIKNASDRSLIEGVTLSARRGLNVTSGTIAKTDNTSNTGTYSLSSMSAGWYTIETTKSGYITSTFHVYACGDQSGQDTFISTTLDPGAMRIVLSWKTTDDLDSHLTGPDNLSGQGHSNAAHEQFHLYYPPASNKFYYATNNFSCSGCSVSQMSDKVTLDLDSFKGIGTCNTCGPETTTISAVRSGTYSYYVHNFNEAGQNNLKLAASAASVKVYYNDTVTTYNVPNSAADLWHVFDFDNSSGFTAINTMGSDSSFKADIFAPTLSEVTPVTTRTNVTTPNYTFSSNEAGTIAYGGSCSSSDTSANVDNNTIAFRKPGGGVLDEGTYSDCTIRVTDSVSNMSDNLSVSSFTIDTTAPSLTQVTAVPTPTRDNTSSYTFTTNEAGTISYSGGCSSSDNTTAVADDNITITFNELADNTYNCSVIVTDNASNQGTLSVQFIIDTTAPTLDNVTDVYTPTSDNTPRYIFSSTEAGDITYGGSCSSSDNSSSVGNNNIDFNTLPDGTYSDCTVTVTDSAGNVSSALPVTPFTVAISPVLEEVTVVPTLTSDNTPDYTFSSTEAGTITYGGACGSSSSSEATSGDNTVTLTQPDNSTALSDGTYDNCTIAVTDNTSNTSDNLPVSSFTVGAFKPALVQITPVPSLTNDNTSNYTFFSTLPGTINYSGDCDSDNTTAVGEDNNTITFKPLDEGPHSNCKISVTTSGGVTSDNLSVNSFVIDTIAPSLSQVTAVTNPINSRSPNYTFYSDEAGDITYGGSCIGEFPSGHANAGQRKENAVADNNTITLQRTNGSVLTDGITYSDCKISVTDNASNTSDNLTVNTFTVDVTRPTLNYVTGGRVPTPDNVSTPDYTFNSSEAGDITYAGNCGSSSSSAATSGDNTVTLTQPDNSTALSDGTYSNCTIKVTDNASNESYAHTVQGHTQRGTNINSFTIGATKPALDYVINVPTPSNDNTSTYIFYSTLPGTINYSGSCDSDNYTNASADNNTVIFNALPDNTYSDCKISVTTNDNSSTSDNLSVNSFTIDTTAPTLSSLTIQSNNDNTTIARVDDRITLTINALENIQKPTVLIAGNSASVSPSSGIRTSWSATYTMQSSDTDGTVSYSVNFTDTLGNGPTTVTITTNGSAVLFDNTAPTLDEITAVSTPTSDSTPNYTFYSSEAGTITYGGDCDSDNTTAVGEDNNTITFNALADNTYSNCTITVTDITGNTSENLPVSPFKIDTTAPTLSPVTLVSTLTGDSTPNYTFNSNEAGTITYGGACGSSTSSAAISGDNTVTLTQTDNVTPLDDRTYDNCTIAVTDNTSNTSDNLPVNSFTIGAVKPILQQVTAVPNPTNDNTPNYTFFSTLPGTINYSGDCDSDNTSAVGDDNNTTVTFKPLAEADHSNCKISVTTNDNSSTSDNLSVNSFTIDTTAPTLSPVTPVPTPDNDSTPNYTFYSNQAGEIIYGGNCDSSDTSADADNNTITFNTLEDATYSDCYITVRDNASNTSDNLTVNTFTIDTTGPVLDNVTNVPPHTSDNTSSYSFDSDEAGAITYGGSCESTTSAAVVGTNNIIFNALADGSYDNCTIKVTDNLSNASSLSVNTFEIDTIDPIETEVTAVTTPGNDTTPSYTFRSTEAGTITYGGSCSSSDTSATVGDNDIDFRKPDGAVLDEDSYGDCTIKVTDGAGNTDNSTPLTVSTFIIDTTAPTVVSVYPADNQNGVSITTDNISVTFSDANAMDNNSVTSNTSDTSCSGSFQLSPDNFSSCVQMSSSPSSSDNKTFELAPSLTLFYSTKYKIRITTAARDIAGNVIASQITQTNGFNTTDSIPITAGSAHSCFILDNGSVKCWGANASGQLGLGDTSSRGDGPNEMGDNLTVIDLGTGRTVRDIEAGDNHTCAILDNSSVKCWGSNASGQLGLGHTNSRGDELNQMGDNLPAVDLGTGRTATAIAAGYQHTCAILDNSSIKCWGLNDSGQLGQGDTDSRGDGLNEMGDNLTAVDLGTGRTATAIAAGYKHTCAILDNSSIKCWGLNDEGQLGLNADDSRGDEPDEMGDNLPAIDLKSTGRTAASITTGDKHTCVMDDNASIKCWGYGYYGQLGRGDQKSYNKPPQNVLELGSGRNAKAIVTGNSHTCVMLDNSSIKCWGLNDSGQLGQGDTNNRGDGIGGNPNNLPSIDLGSGKTARGISAGDRHTCAILDNASIKCWGSNNSGELGIGEPGNLGDNSSEMGDNLPVISL